jgi:glyoxylate reductase
MNAATHIPIGPTAASAKPLVLAEKAVTSTLSRTGTDALARQCCLVEIDNLASWLATPTRASEVRGILITGRSVVDGGVLGRLPGLEVVSVRAVGYDRVSIPACVARGITVCNTPGVLDGAVADFTMLLVLALARRLPDNLRDARERWQSSSFSVGLGTDVRGKVLGVLGMGRIGSLLARTAASGFAMDVMYHNRNKLPVAKSGEARYVARDELFSESDFVSIHLPLTPQTRGSVGAAELTLMRETAFLVNTSRGEILVEQAVLEALEQRKIAGAALDVTSMEPYPGDGPLRRDDVLLTPHAASATRETRQAMSDLAAKSLLEALRGSRPATALTPDFTNGKTTPRDPSGSAADVDDAERRKD